ncbi:MAG: alkaline phosphatase family protein [Candidatus Eisenbacteria bacterium]
MRGFFIIALCCTIALAVSCAPTSVEPVERRIMLIGIDGMEWDIMGPLLEAGRLPTFARIMSEGSWGELRSLDILESPVIWTSIATGKLPEKHGIMGFAKKSPKGGEPVPITSNVRRVEAIWDILGDEGWSVGIVGWLSTWPAEPVNGYLVTDYFNYGWGPEHTGEGERVTFPPGLAADIEDLRVLEEDITDERAAAFTNGVVPEGDVLRKRFNALKACIATDETSHSVALRLADRMPVDFYAVYLKGIDGVCHLYWVDMIPESGPPVTEEEKQTFGSVIASYYEEMDGVLAGFLEMVDENTTLILTSDHGHSGPKPVGDKYNWGIAMHDPTGVLALWGKDIAKGQELVDASVLDITPTLLALCGLPVADDMDGRVLTEAIDGDFLRGHPVRTIETYEPDAGSSGDDEREPIESPIDEEVRERLRALGYIE